MNAAVAIPLLWLVWGAYWAISARRLKGVARVESWASRATHVVPLVMALVLLWLPSVPVAWLSDRFMPIVSFAHAIGALLVALGLGLAVWARAHLGANWSGGVAIRHEHGLIRSGPYRAVRHPIYAGLLLAVAGSALALGEWRGVVSVVLATLALGRKLALEERWLANHFGDDYELYRRTVKALVPFVW